MKLWETLVYYNIEHPKLLPTNVALITVNHPIEIVDGYITFIVYPCIRWGLDLATVHRYDNGEVIDFLKKVLYNINMEIDEGESI